MTILFLRNIFQQPRENPTLKWASDKEEGQRHLRQFFETERNIGWTKHCAVNLLSSITKEPSKFENVAETVSLILDQGLDRHMIDWNDDHLDFLIWSMASKDKRPETARAGAILVAELIAHRLGETTYRLPMIRLLNNCQDPEANKASILAIQNALVDLVTESKDSSSLVSGAEKLALLQGDDDAKLWSEKLSDIKMTEDNHPLAAGLTQGSLKYKSPDPR